MQVFLLQKMDIVEDKAIALPARVVPPLGCDAELRLRTELNYSILRLNFPIISGIFTKISQNFANFLQSSLSLDILEHVREIPTKFHLNFGEK